MMKNRQTEIERIVAAIDETRMAEHFRNPDRPDSRFVKARRRQDPAIRRAKIRLRTAAYRSRLDARGAPATSVIGMALVTALVTSRKSEMTRENWDLVARALIDLRRRGFDLAEIRDTLHRFRRRVMTVDRDDEAVDNPVV